MSLSLHVGPTSYYHKSHHVNWPEEWVLPSEKILGQSQVSGPEVSKIRNWAAFLLIDFRSFTTLILKMRKKLSNKHSEYSYLAGQKFLKIEFPY